MPGEYLHAMRRPVAGEFKKSLNRFKVPTAEQGELFEIVGKTRPDIVVRD
jgi:hemoglobin